MSRANRQAKIEELLDGYRQLMDLIEEYPAEARDFRPAPTGWTVKEIVGHLVDSEANNFVRSRKIIAEPGSTIVYWDETAWYNASHYSELDLYELLHLLHSLRAFTAHLLKRQPDTAWEASANHEVDGPITLEAWLDAHLRHTNLHLNQIRQNFEAFGKMANNT